MVHVAFEDKYLASDFYDINIGSRDRNDIFSRGSIYGFYKLSVGSKYLYECPFR